MRYCHRFWPERRLFLRNALQAVEVATNASQSGFPQRTLTLDDRFSLPSGLEALFEQNKVVKTHCLVLGIENSYAISYTGSDDLLHLRV